MTTDPFLSREFPDFDQSTLPVIPLGFMPAHWRNEPMPHWTRGDVGLFIDFADRNLREFQDEDVKRFCLQTGDYGGPCETIVVSDDWQDILNAIAVYDWRRVEA